MKNIRIFLIIPLLSILLFACDENEPEYNLNRQVEEAERKVLIEEITGVRCVNCPAGSAEIENLKSIYGDNLVAVSIHAGFFADPYPENNKELRIQAGEDILDYLGQPIGYPTAVVDRRQFSGEDNLHLGQSEWAGAISQEINRPAEVNIDLESSFDQDSRNLDVTATIVVAEETGEPLYITALITEDGIIDAQKVPGMSDPKLDYEHNHVLRGMLTSTLGDQLPTLHVEGDFAEEDFNMTLPDAWVAEKCHVVVFVHHKDNDKRVLQVEETPVTD